MRVEESEPRLARTTYIVQTTGDAAGSVTQVSPGAFTAPTLRAAVDAANRAGIRPARTFR